MHRKALRERLRSQKEEEQPNKKAIMFNQYEIEKIVKSIKSQHYHQRIQQINQVPDILQRFHHLQSDSKKLYHKIEKDLPTTRPSTQRQVSKPTTPRVQYSLCDA